MAPQRQVPSIVRRRRFGADVHVSSVSQESRDVSSKEQTSNLFPHQLHSLRYRSATDVRRGVAVSEAYFVTQPLNLCSRAVNNHG